MPHYRLFHQPFDPREYSPVHQTVATGGGDAYIAEKRFEFTGAEFVNHYEAKGWMIGKTKMKSWRAACRTWQNRRDEEKKKKGNFTPSGGVKPREDYSNAGKTRRTVAAG